MWKRRSPPPRPDPAEALFVVAEGFELGGRLAISRPAILNGRLHGEIVSTSSVIIGEAATVHAEIRARSVTVRGEVVGDITATDRIDVESGARVVGDLEAPQITIGAGVLFQGACRMLAGDRAGRTPAPGEVEGAALRRA